MTQAWKRSQDAEKLQKELDEQKAELAALRKEHQERERKEAEAQEKLKAESKALDDEKQRASDLKETMEKYDVEKAAASKKAADEKQIQEKTKADKDGEVQEVLTNFGKRMDEMSSIRLKMEKDIVNKKKDLKEQIKMKIDKIDQGMDDDPTANIEENITPKFEAQLNSTKKNSRLGQDFAQNQTHQSLGQSSNANYVKQIQEQRIAQLKVDIEKEEGLKSKL